MTKAPTAIALATLFTTVSLAQTTTARRPPTHRPASAIAKSTPAVPTTNPADTPPNVPAIEGTPKPLYALRYVDTLVGTGDLAPSRKWYSVRYTGWLTNGTKFDSSDDHPGKDPISFPYGAHQVIPGWDTGFEGMHIGGKRRLYIPYQLAYGEAGRPPVIPAKADLIFDIELVSVSDTNPSQPPVAPVQPGGESTKPASEPSAAPSKTTAPADPTKPTATPSPNSTNPTTPQSPPK